MSALSQELGLSQLLADLSAAHQRRIVTALEQVAAARGIGTGEAAIAMLENGLDAASRELAP